MHKRDNIETKAMDLGLPDQQSKEILNMIFGYQVNNTFFTGLVDITSMHDIKDKLQILKATWHEICSEFCQ